MPVASLAAMPPEAVAVATPLRVPAPFVFANVTEVVLSLVTGLPPASRISTVSGRDVPDARFADELVNVRWSGAPATTLNVVLLDVSEVADALIVIEPASSPLTFL